MTKIVQDKIIEWEDFISQHEGIQLIKDFYNLTDQEIIKACIASIVKLIEESKQ